MFESEWRLLTTLPDLPSAQSLAEVLGAAGIAGARALGCGRARPGGPLAPLRRGRAAYAGTRVPGRRPCRRRGRSVITLDHLHGSRRRACHGLNASMRVRPSGRAAPGAYRVALLGQKVQRQGVRSAKLPDRCGSRQAAKRLHAAHFPRIKGHCMRLPAFRHSGRASFGCSAIAAVLAAGVALAQQPPNPTAAPATAPAKKAAAAPKAAPGARSPSYSLGVSMGDQLRNNGVPRGQDQRERAGAGRARCARRQGAVQRHRQAEHQQAHLRGAGFRRGDQPPRRRQVPRRERQEPRRGHDRERPAVQDHHARQRRPAQAHRRGDGELQGHAGRWHRVRQQLQARRAGQIPAQPRDPGLVRGRGSDEAGREVRALRAAAAGVRPAPAAGRPDPPGRAADLRGGAAQRQGGARGADRGAEAGRAAAGATPPPK